MILRSTASIASICIGVLLLFAACDSSSITSDDGAENETPLTLAFTTTMTGSSTAATMSRSGTASISDRTGNVLTIERAEIAISKIEFESDSGSREDVEQGPILVDLPLGGGVPETITEASLPEGVWEEVEFEVDKLERDDPDAAELLDQTGFPEGFSIRVQGVWTPDGGPERDFTFLSDIDEEQELEFKPSLVVSVDQPKTVNFRVDLDSWFRTEDGTLVNPEEGNSGGRFEDLIEENIERSIEAEDADAEEIEVEGRIESLSDNQITVRGTTFRVNSQTEIEGDKGIRLAFSDLRPGDKVEVEGYRDRSDNLIAKEIEWEADDIEVEGQIDSISQSSLTVNGITFQITSRTEFKDDLRFSDLEEGDTVEVDGFRNRSGELVADEIERKDDEEGENEVEVEGVIEALTGDSITVNGFTFLVTSNTEIEDDDRTLSLSDLQEGDGVEVEGYRNASGDLVADEVELE